MLKSLNKDSDLFLAHSNELGFAELCVIKHLGLDGEADSLYERERARRAMVLHHENLVSVLDLGLDGRQIYGAIEYVQGRDLQNILITCSQRGVALPIEAALYICIEISKGLRELHRDRNAYPLLSRAIEPSNILVSFDGEIKISMARIRDSIRPPKRHNDYCGLSYQAPEKLSTDLASPRADLYSLGMVLWDLLVGKPLFSASLSKTEAIKSGQRAENFKASSYNKDLDNEIDTILHRALKAEPNERFQSTEEFRAALASLLATRRPSFDASAISDTLIQLYGDAMISEERREYRKLFAASQQSSDRFAVANTEEIDTINDDFSDNSFKENLAGQMLVNRYRIEKRIGEGGMGAVYLAEHVDLGRSVAVKILHAAYSNDFELVRRFRQEARAAAEVGHPNIIEVTDFGTTDQGRIFFVMEHLEGQDLAQIMAKQRKIPIPRALAILQQICEALHAAHDSGIVHRDLKPENVFLIEKDGQSDVVKILDFGVAINMETIRRGDVRLTTPGMAMGTPEYMAPEQASGQSIDRRIDVYATTVMFYEMLTGRLPHEGETLMALLNKKATEDPVAPSRYLKDIPTHLEQVILRGLAQSPEERYQTMEELADALKQTELTPELSSSDTIARSSEFNIAAKLVETKNTTRNDDFTGELNKSNPTLIIRHQKEVKKKPIFLALLLLISGIGFATWHTLKNSEQKKSERQKLLITQNQKTKKKEFQSKKIKPTPLKNIKKEAKAKAKPQPALKRKRLTEEEVRLHLEWAKRAARGRRYTKPRGDNVRDNLARIEKDYPNHPQVLAFRKTFCRKKRYEAKKAIRKKRTLVAQSAYRACLLIDPHAKVKKSLAYTYLIEAKKTFRKKKYNTAKKIAIQALKQVPHLTSANELLGDISMRQRKYRSAKAYYAEALKTKKVRRKHRRQLKRKLALAKKKSR